MEYFVVYRAALRSGLYLTALNHHLTARETAYTVRDCGAKALVISGRMARVATELLAQTPAVAVQLAMGATVDGHDNYEAAIATASPGARLTSRSVRSCSTHPALVAPPRPTRRHA